MNRTICIFEDAGYRKLFPLAYTRPVYDLRCGVTTLREKIVRSYPGAEVVLHVREYLSDVVQRDNPGLKINTLFGKGCCLFINGRLLAGDDIALRIPVEGDDRIYVRDGVVVAARVSGVALDRIRLSDTLGIESFSGGKEEVADRTSDLGMIQYPWELVQRNGEQLEKDCAALADLGHVEGEVYEGAYLLGPSNIYIAPGAKVKPGVVLDAERGPIFIDQGAKIFPNATIEGPAYIGKKTQIKIGAKIYEGTTIGEVCKVGGEVEGSIIHSYSNKQHDGFLGHAYLGMWVNLGADTNNSDLKNNYSSVRVTINGEEIDTGSMFVGLTMGDHSKSGINTMFNTGTVVGAVCNVFGAGFPPKEIPSFAWGGADEVTLYDPERAIEVCRRVMARRDVPLTEVDAQLLRKVFELTAKDRERVGVR